MITYKEYKQKPLSYWKGKKVETLGTMQNGRYVIPKGTILIIVDKYAGFGLRGVDVCPHCKIGVRIYINRVEPTAIKLYNERLDA